ncbi:enoyl-CoA hydratase/isomerase family protein [Halomarina halobia]|uniref:Enoyl-CoA hydratase/isomerase family protein n=1 Tax=Halomarina halobia TaxID=3033386 RepID=A0ABD6AFP2_9EURY|nr:enoyl-CoA hydratase/isomerase family protein [Halomarina sp. PSR21]
MAYDTIVVEESDRRMTVVLDRPGKKNALTTAMFEEMREAVETATERDVGVVTLRGTGGDFSAGVDMSNVPTWIEQKPLEVRDQLEAVHETLEYFESVSLPLVAALEGYVLGGALELAISCDIRVAKRGARFGLPESKLGLVMNYGGAQKLPGLIGEGMTKYLVMTGETIDARRAHEIGLVETLAEPSEFEGVLSDLEETLAEKPRYVHDMAKRQIHSARPLNIDESMQQAIHHAVAAYQEEETQQRSLDFLTE